MNVSGDSTVRNFKTVACTVLKLCYASKSVTNGWTAEQTNEAIYPFKVWGIIRIPGYSQIGSDQLAGGGWMRGMCPVVFVTGAPK